MINLLSFFYTVTCKLLPTVSGYFAVNAHNKDSSLAFAATPSLFLSNNTVFAPLSTSWSVCSSGSSISCPNSALKFESLCNLIIPLATQYSGVLTGSHVCPMSVPLLLLLPLPTTLK